MTRGNNGNLTKLARFWRPVGFVYHVGAVGVRIELIDGSRKLDFEQWLAGGRLVEATP